MSLESSTWSHKPIKNVHMGKGYMEKDSELIKDIPNSRPNSSLLGFLPNPGLTLKKHENKKAITQ